MLIAPEEIEDELIRIGTDETESKANRIFAAALSLILLELEHFFKAVKKEAV